MKYQLQSSEDSSNPTHHYWTFKANKALITFLQENKETEIEFVSQDEAILYVSDNSFHLKISESEYTVSRFVFRYFQTKTLIRMFILLETVTLLSSAVHQ
jgi:hypothetical protein